MDAGNIKVNLTLENDGFQIAASNSRTVLYRLKQAFDDTSRTAANTERIVHRMGSSFHSTVVMVGALRFALMDVDSFLLSMPKSINKTVGEFQRMQTLMEGLSKSTDELVRKSEGLANMNSVVAFAKSAPFDISALTDTFVKLKTAGVDPMAGGMEALVNSVAKFGGTSDTLKRASVAIQQMAGKGVISMEELRQQLGEAVPNAIHLMARGMDMSMSDLVDKISKGMVKARPALARMFAQMELDAAGAAKRMMNTIPGAFQRMTTEFELFKKTVGEQGFDTAVAALFREISSFLGSSDGRQFARELGESLRSATEAAIHLGRWLVQNTALLKALGIAAVAAFGGAKLAAAHEAMKKRAKDQLDLEQKAADAANKRNQDEIARLTQQNKLRAQAMADALAAVKKERADFEAANNAKVESLNRLANAQNKALQQEISALEALKNKRAELAKQGQFYDLAASESAPDGRMDGRNAKGQFVKQQDLAMSKEMLASANAVNEQRKALEGQIAALEKSTQAKQRNIEITQRKITATRDATVVESGYSRAMKSFAEDQRRAILATNQQITAQRSLGQVARSSSSAVVAFGRSLAGATVYSIAFTAIISGLVWAWNKVTGAAREAEEAQMRAIRAKQGVQTEDDLKKNRELLDSEEENLRDLQAQRNLRQESLNELRAKGTSATQLKGASATLSVLDKKIAESMSRIASLKVAIQDATTVVGRRNSDEAAANYISKLAGDLSDDSDIAKLNQSYAELNTKLAEAQSKGDEKLIATTNKEFSKMSAELQKLKIKKGQLLFDAQFAKLTDPREKAEFKRQFEAMKKGWYDELAQITADPLGAGKNKNRGSKHKADNDPWAEWVSSTLVEAERAKENAKAYADGILSAAEVRRQAELKVDKMIADGQLKTRVGDKLVAPDAQKREVAILAMVRSMDTTQAEKAVQKVTQLVDQLQADQERIDAVFSGDTKQKPNKHALQAERMLRQLEPYKEQIEKVLKDLGFSWDEFVGKLKTSTATLGISEMVAGFNADLKRMGEQAVRDDVERERKITQNRIDEAAKRLTAKTAELLASGTLDEEHVKKLRDTYAAFDAWQQAMWKDFAIRTEGPIAKMAREWSNGMKAMESATTSWANNFVDQLADGSFKMSAFVQSVLTDIAKLSMRKAMSEGIGNILDSVKTGLGGMLGLSDGLDADKPRIDAATGAMLVKNVDGVGGIAGVGNPTRADIAKLFDPKGGMMDDFKRSLSGMWDGLADSLGQMVRGISDSLRMLGSQTFGSGGLISGIASLFGFANGGVMTALGPATLRAYANGGIANSPQLAMFGEGSRPEAFVPLPDGRSIPVSLRGGGAQGPTAVEVNMINQTGTPAHAEATTRFDGGKMILDVVLSAVSRPGGFRDGMKGALR